jgi:branched-chain amino acid transport system substrate-binding protein
MTSLGKFIIAIAVVIALVFGVRAVMVPKTPAAPTILKIGFIGPLSGSSSQIGDPMQQAIQLAVDELKAAGTPVEVLFADDSCNPKDAVLAMQKMKDVDQVSVFIGGVCDDEAAALANAAQESKVVLMIPSVPTTLLSSAGDYIFRNTQPDAQGGSLLGDAAGKTRKTIADLSESTDEARAYHDKFNDAFALKGGIITSDEQFASGAKDFSPLLAKMKKTMPKAEALFLNVRNDVSATAILDGLIKLNWKLPIYGYPTLVGKAELPKYKALLEGMMFAEAPHLDATNPAAQAFMKAYTDKYGKMYGVDVYNAGGYEAVKMFAAGFAGGAKTASAMRDYLTGLKTFVGAQGDYHFDGNGDMVGVPFLLKSVKNGKGELVK